MSWKNNLRKSELKKMQYDITWKKIKVDYLSVKNKPEGLKNIDGKFDTVEATAEGATIRGEFSADVRSSRIKEIGSRADEISLRIIFEDTETDLYEEFDVDIMSPPDTIEDNMHDGNLKINPAYIEVELDMKGQKDPEQFEKIVRIYWEGTY